MENLLIILAAIFCFSTAKAQRFVAGSVGQGQFTTFTVVSLTKDSILVNDAANTFVNEEIKLKLYPPTAFRRQQSALTQSFLMSIPDVTLKQLISEVAIDIIFYVNADGKVADVSYKLKGNTQLTAYDLEKLSLRIKEIKRFTFRSSELNGNRPFMVIQRVNYRQLADHNVD